MKLDHDLDDGYTRAAESGSTDVAIIGGGISGLTAAAVLQWSSQLDFQVLEKEGWLGGRTKSERFSLDAWANFGAQYVSEDKTKITELSSRVGAELIPAPFGAGDAMAQVDTKYSQQIGAEIKNQIKRLEAEQLNERPAHLWELDKQTFVQWLGDASHDSLGFWDHWAGGMMCASITELSLIGVMWFWGNQRTSPWNTSEVETTGLGSRVIRGGTQELATGLAREANGRASTYTEVEAVTKDADRLVIYANRNGTPVKLYASHVIFALPAPLVRQICSDLPTWKSNALDQVRYGRYLSTPIAVTHGDSSNGILPDHPSRPFQRYNGNDFRLRTPGDIDAHGCVYHSYVYDVHARQIWDDSDISIKNGAMRALLEHHPEYRNRLHWVGLQRWQYGLPQIAPHYMDLLPVLRAPVGSLYFCGDYCMPPNMEGAARNGERAALEVISAFG